MFREYRTRYIHVSPDCEEAIKRYEHNKEQLSMADSVQKMSLETDLQFLEKLQQLLHSTADEKINQILTDGKNWLSHDGDVETRQLYANIKQITGHAISSVSQICQHISAGFQDREHEEVSTGSEMMRSRKSSKASGETSDIKLMTSQMKAMEKKMSSITQTVDKLKSSHDQISSKYSQLEDDFNTKFDRTDDQIKEMATHMKDVVDEHTTRVDDLEKKLNALTLQFKGYREDEGNGNLQQVQLEMEKLQHEQEKMRTHVQELEDQENKTKKNIEKASETIQCLTSDLKALETKCIRSTVAFTARLPSEYKPVQDIIITGYEKVMGNKDKNFSKDTGIFTAPVKGMYVVCLRHRQWYSGKIGMQVTKTNKSGSNTTATSQPTTEWICRTGTKGDNQGDFHLTVTELEVGDTLHVVPNYVIHNPSLSPTTSFSCFLRT